MRVETFYFDAEGNQVAARDAVSGEVRQYDDRDRLVLTVHLESLEEDGRQRWYQVRALGSPPAARPAPDAKTAVTVAPDGSQASSRPTAEAG